MTANNLSSIPKSIKICSVEECETKHRGKGFCRKHLYRIQKYGDPFPGLDSLRRLTCEVEHCQGKYHAQGYCQKHYRRWKQRGNPLLAERYGQGENPAERFWSRVKTDANDKGCWEWQARCNKQGYGSICVNNKKMLVTHYVWFLTYDKYPDQFMLHSCDTPPCVNPKHLREGTHQDNTADKVSRNRQARGSSCRAKLKESDIPKIRQSIREGLSDNKIGAMLNVNAMTIFSVRHGITWKYV